jgi:hypothetical protein
MSFERIRMLHGIGVLCYEAYTVAEDLSWLGSGYWWAWWAARVSIPAPRD